MKEVIDFIRKEGYLVVIQDGNYLLEKWTGPNEKTTKSITVEQFNILESRKYIYRSNNVSLKRSIWKLNSFANY
jgi:hypothetical protein